MVNLYKAMKRPYLDEIDRAVLYELEDCQYKRAVQAKLDMARSTKALKKMIEPFYLRLFKIVNNFLLRCKKYDNQTHTQPTRYVYPKKLNTRY